MFKLLIITLATGLIFSPLSVFASPGAVDQYGSHSDAITAYHYHEIPLTPNYFQLNSANADPKQTFYQPKTQLIKTVQLPEKLTDSELTDNATLDQTYCQDKIVMAGGKYDSTGSARIKPVCAAAEVTVLKDKTLTASDYYKVIDPSSTKAYHYRFKGNIRILTDKPTSKELIGKVVQGETDSVMYTVVAGDSELPLRPIDLASVINLLGEDFAGKIIKFDDSIVYSYKISKDGYSVLK